MLTEFLINLKSWIFSPVPSLTLCKEFEHVGPVLPAYETLEKFIVKIYEKIWASA